MIDGYNLLHALKNAYPGQFPRAFHPGRDRLLALLSKFARSHNATVTVFFDGNSGPVEPGEFAQTGVRVKFCGPGDQTADRAICHEVEGHGNPASLTVVTNDRQVATMSRHEGALVESCDQFISRLGVGQAPGVSSPRAEREDRSGPTTDSKKQSAKQGRRNKATPPDGKPSGGHIGDIEREMLNDIGDDWENLDDE
ncbi:MAG: NYN domain-containing protein [Planctomycetes bacterium]|nr:NYN domain-containing protein [Planctomycetota bacterium]